MSKDKIYNPLPHKTWTTSGKSSENGYIKLELNNTWIMKIENIKGKRKIYFNTKEFPDLAPDDFAKQVIKILHESSLLDDLINQEVDVRLNNKKKL